MLFTNYSDIPYVAIPFDWLLTEDDRNLLEDKKEVVQLVGLKNYDLGELTKEGSLIENELSLMYSTKEGHQPFAEKSSSSKEILNKSLVEVQKVIDSLEYGELYDVRLIKEKLFINENDEEERLYVFQIVLISDSEGVVLVNVEMTIGKSGEITSIKNSAPVNSNNSDRRLSIKNSAISDDETLTTSRWLDHFFSQVSNKNVYLRYKQENAKSNLDRHLKDIDVDDESRAVLKEMFLSSEGMLSTGAIRSIELSDQHANAQTTIELAYSSKREDKSTFYLVYDRVLGSIFVKK